MFLGSAVVAGLGYGIKKFAGSGYGASLFDAFASREGEILPKYLGTLGKDIFTGAGNTMIKAGLGGVAGYGVGTGIDYLSDDNRWAGRLGKMGFLGGLGHGVYADIGKDKFNPAFDYVLGKIRGANKATSVATGAAADATAKASSTVRTHAFV